MVVLVETGTTKQKQIAQVVAIAQEKNVEVRTIEKATVPHIPVLPAIIFGREAEDFVAGEEAVRRYLQDGYLSRAVGCPYDSFKPCRKKACAKYVVLTEGLIQHGECSDHWTPRMIIELKETLTKLAAGVQ
jgi:hypothetical protein